jgi:ribulose-phosphate 3-epimerase
MAIILPAILEQTKSAFENKAYAVTRIPGVQRIHVDFADGDFVPNKMLAIEAMDTLNPAFEWEAHLMIREPTEFLDYKIAGFKKIILHFEAFSSAPKLIESIEQINKLGLAAAVAINPFTALSAVAQCNHITNQFTVMGVVPGFQGAEFVPETFDRVKALRNLVPDGIIEVDGSVKIYNAGQLAQSGADLLVVGSGLWETEDINTNFTKLSEAAA